MDKALVKEYVYSQRGGQLLIINKFKFRKRKVLRHGGVYWACSTSGCKAHCHTREEDIISHSLDHNHLPDVRKLGRQVLNNACKRKAVDCILEPPSEIVKTVFIHSSYNENLTAEDLRCVRRNVSRNRSRNMRGKSIDTEEEEDEQPPANNEKGPTIKNEQDDESYGMVVSSVDVDLVSDCSRILDALSSSFSTVIGDSKDPLKVESTCKNEVSIKEEIKTELGDEDYHKPFSIGHMDDAPQNAQELDETICKDEGQHLGNYVTFMFNTFTKPITKAIFRKKLEELISDMQILDVT